MSDAPVRPTTTAMPFDARQFRDVLGHLPSGVVAITGVDADDRPIGMVVGSFTSVSLQPALVAFFVDKTSTSFPRIRETRAFCANILSAQQEQLCRALSARGGEKFAGVQWRPAGSGSPILADAVAWVDCDIDSVAEAGDHLIVIGRVRELGISTPTIPLLFFQGGFGGFAPTSLAAQGQGALFETLRYVDRIRAGMESLALEFDVDCLAHAVNGPHTTVVAAAYAPNRSSTYTQVGYQLPLVPPWAEPFMAWSPADDLDRWLDQLRMDRGGRYDADAIADHIREIRSVGWAFTTRAVSDDDDRPLEDLLKYGYTPAVERALSDLILRRGTHGEHDRFDELPPGTVRNISAPVIDAKGNLALMVVLHNLPAELTGKNARIYLERLLDLTRAEGLPE